MSHTPKYPWLYAPVNRARRRAARYLFKSKPDFVYRIDGRPPELIRSVGFLPWQPNGTLELMDHVLKGAAIAREQSQWVSTGAYAAFETIEPKLSTMIPGKNFYMIDFAEAENLGSGRFVDVNAHFDARNVDREFGGQREWAYPGTIPGKAVVFYMPSATFQDIIMDTKHGGGVGKLGDAMELPWIGL